MLRTVTRSLLFAAALFIAVPSTPVLASSDARLQIALAHDAQFLNRVQYTMGRVALSVISEAHGNVGQPTDAQHVTRRAYAAEVLGNPAAAAASMAVGLVGAVNLTSRTTTINPDLTITTDATDAEIESQVATLWNSYAGV